MKFETIFRLKDTKIKAALATELQKFGYKNIHNKKKFLYAEGNAPYMLVAHLDTVHNAAPDIICYSKNGDYVMSPQGIGGDDRCGVYIILELLKALKWKPYVVFTMEEEIGGKGADAFVEYMSNKEIPELKYIVEYDRKGNNDCVFYNCDNQEFIDFVEGFGFKEAYGSFSDISVIAPAFGVAAVNISSGYYNPHTQHEYVCVSDMREVIEKSLNMLNTECKAFEYIEYVSKYTYKGQYSSSWIKEMMYGCEVTKTGIEHPYKQVKVTIVPAQTVIVSLIDEYHINENSEIAVDEYGNVYKYSRYFNDYNLTYVELYDLEGNVATNLYDESNVTMIDVYNA